MARLEGRVEVVRASEARTEAKAAAGRVVAVRVALVAAKALWRMG